MNDKLRNNSLYDTFSYEEKQIYWNTRISRIYRGDYKRFPIKISDFRNNIGVEENNFERFIPGIIESFEKWLGEDFSIEDFFILDEEGKKKLGVCENSSVKKDTNSILDGETSISGVEIPT